MSSFEELDLLVKSLGPETSNQVLNIRAAHANNPTLGLKMAWERLDNKFGCPEMVDEALKKKLHNFPRLSNKDNRKLYDLADIVSEIEALKLDPKYCSILSYYDASSGVIPIVNKPPFNLRESGSHMLQTTNKNIVLLFRHLVCSVHLCAIRAKL